MTEKSKEPLHVAGRLYVKKLIRVRRAIIAKRINTLPKGQEVCDELDKLLNYWPYDTDEKLAYFFISKRDKIISLIPGPMCPSHRALSQEFYELHTLCLKAKYHEYVC